MKNKDLLAILIGLFGFMLVVIGLRAHDAVSIYELAYGMIFMIVGGMVTLDDEEYSTEED